MRAIVQFSTLWLYCVMFKLIKIGDEMNKRKERMSADLFWIQQPMEDGA